MPSNIIPSNIIPSVAIPITPGNITTTIPSVATTITPNNITPTMPDNRRNNNITQPRQKRVFDDNVMEKPPNLSYPVTTNYTEDMIEYTRHNIHRTISLLSLNENPNFQSPPDILMNLFDSYDSSFFQKALKQIMITKNITLNIEYSEKMTKTGGHCEKNGCIYTIRISAPVIMNTFRNGERAHPANGSQCYDRLECLMNIFEHELIHFVIGITHGHVKKDPIYGSHGLFFQQLAMAYFGHTEFTHSLNSGLEVDGKREDFQVGNYVTYKSKTGALVTSVITQINRKTAGLGNITAPFQILRHATPDEINNMISSGNNSTNTNINNTTTNNFRLGDIVSFNTKNGIITDRISKINIKTYSIGNYNVPMNTTRTATDQERATFLANPSIAAYTRDNFRVGQNVQFTNSKTNQKITGVISKLNPSKAVVGTYNVPYSMLRPII